MAYLKVALGLTLACVTALGLYHSHTQAYRAGVRHVTRPRVEALTKADQDAAAVHLSQALVSLRLLAKRPDEAKREQVEAVQSRAELFLGGVERRVIPRLKKEGRTSEVERHEALVAEARRLLPAPRPKGKK